MVETMSCRENANESGSEGPFHAAESRGNDRPTAASAAQDASVCVCARRSARECAVHECVRARVSVCVRVHVLVCACMSAHERAHTLVCACVYRRVWPARPHCKDFGGLFMKLDLALSM